jgi:hypothetical protein
MTNKTQQIVPGELSAFQSKPRKKSFNGESKLQSACVKWFRLQYPNELIFAIPNGEKRSKITASILKGQGVLSGVYDLMLMCSRKGWHGLFIEIKFGKNNLTDNQKVFKGKATDAGYLCVECWTFEQFQQQVEHYLAY